MIINTSAKVSIWELQIAASRFRPYLSPVPASWDVSLGKVGGRLVCGDFESLIASSEISIVIVALFIISCNGFNVTIPLNPTAGQPAVLQWNATSPELDPPDSGPGGVAVLVIAGDFQCPKSDFVNSFGSAFFQTVDTKAVVMKPVNSESETPEGNLTIEFKQSGRNNNQDDTKPKNDIATIVAGAAGGVAVLGVALAIFFYVRWKSARVGQKGSDTEQHFLEETEHTITPYPVLGSIPTAENQNWLKLLYRRRRKCQTAAVQRSLSLNCDTPDTNTSPRDGEYPAIGLVEDLRNERSGEGRVRNRVRRHEDSGWRPPAEVAPPPTISGSGSMIDVPPTYKEAS
ncbi:hypothetical protein V5O48_011397 [Marasmius crinis-equi]|uniref:Uncharacterized protein n=1 Tax=Marasmius crinis-equi TaxID=585013 RepID=A0ABR3F644_9AGAR